VGTAEVRTCLPLWYHGEDEGSQDRHAEEHGEQPLITQLLLSHFNLSFEASNCYSIFDCFPFLASIFITIIENPQWTMSWTNTNSHITKTATSLQPSPSTQSKRYSNRPPPSGGSDRSPYISPSLASWGRWRTARQTCRRPCSTTTGDSTAPSAATSRTRWISPGKN
jgi:hypothetical protein